MAATPIFAGDTVLVSSPSVNLSVGDHPFGPSAVPTAWSVVVAAYDITSHGAGNTSAVSLMSDISLDGGATWQPFVGFARDKGYAPTTEPGVPLGWAYVRIALPQPGNPNRQVRGVLTIANAPLKTAAQIEGQ
jgi:hypothetical protein